MSEHGGAGEIAKGAGKSLVDAFEFIVGARFISTPLEVGAYYFLTEGFTYSSLKAGMAVGLVAACGLKFAIEMLKGLSSGGGGH